MVTTSAARTGLSRNRLWIWCAIGGVGAIVVGVIFPLAFFAVFVVVVVLLRPSIGVVLVIAIEGLRLAFVTLGVPSATLTQAVTALLLLSLVGSARKPKSAGWIAPWIVGLILVSLGPGILTGFASLPAGQVIAGLSLLITPVACFAVGVTSDHHDRALFKVTLLAVVWANVCAALIQLSTGTQGLLAAGLGYGVTVREIDGVLRAPGLTLTNSAAGLIGAAAVVWFIFDMRRERLVSSITGIAGGGTLVLLATSRSGLILAGVAAAVYTLVSLGDSARSGGRRAIQVALVTTLALAAVSLFVDRGASSAFSLGERFVVWGERLQSGLPIFGKGTGSVGAASYSSAATSPPVFVDNTWLSLLLQYGVYGAAIIALTVIALVIGNLIKLQRRFNRSDAVVLSILAALAAVAVVVEVLDYSGPMAIVGFTIGLAIRTRMMGHDDDDPGAHRRMTTSGKNRFERISKGN